MNRNNLWTPVLAICAVTTAGVLGAQPSHAAAFQTAQALSVAGARVVLTGDNGVFPSQRPRYLSGSNGTSESRFARSPDPAVNPWGLTRIPPDVGLVILRPGETDRTAGDQDLGARAAGATHGHAPVVMTE
jgi:hypothetical protein